MTHAHTSGEGKRNTKRHAGLSRPSNADTHETPKPSESATHTGPQQHHSYTSSAALTPAHIDLTDHAHAACEGNRNTQRHVDPARPSDADTHETPKPSASATHTGPQQHHSNTSSAALTPAHIDLTAQHAVANSVGTSPRSSQPPPPTAAINTPATRGNNSLNRHSSLALAPITLAQPVNLQGTANALLGHMMATTVNDTRATARHVHEQHASTHQPTRTSSSALPALTPPQEHVFLRNHDPKVNVDAWRPDERSTSYPTLPDHVGPVRRLHASRFGACRACRSRFNVGDPQFGHSSPHTTDGPVILWNWYHPGCWWDRPTPTPCPSSRRRLVQELMAARWDTTTTPLSTTICATFPDGIDPRFHVRSVTFPNGNDGWGLFAARDFARGEYIAIYAGQTITEEERQRRRLAGGGDHIMEIGGGLIDGSVGGNGAELINTALHRPGVRDNAAFSATTGSIKALRDIPRGTEICMKYSSSYWAGHRAMERLARRRAGTTAMPTTSAGTRDAARPPPPPPGGGGEGPPPGGPGFLNTPSGGPPTT